MCFNPVFEVIELARDNDRVSAAFDYSIMAIFILSLVPLAFKETTPLFAVINYVTAACFIVDYILRLLWTLWGDRSFKMFRYAKSIRIFVDVIKEQRVPLLAVCSLAIGYVLIAALIVLNVESDTFANFFKALYWATVSLTTAGYGDIYLVTTAGRIVTMLSSFVGIAIVALPAGIITAGDMDRIQRK